MSRASHLAFAQYKELCFFSKVLDYWLVDIVFKYRAFTFVSIPYWILIFFVFLGVSLMGSDLRADQSTISQWTQVLTRVKLPKNWRFYLDLHPRFDLEPSSTHGKEGARQFLVRPAIGYRWSRYFETYVGYTLVENYSPHNTEHDIIEDFMYTRPQFGLPALQRLRAEQRFTEADGEVGHRWRYLYQVSIPLSTSGKVSVVLNDEVFFHLNDVQPSVQRGFTENRALAGLGFSLSQELALTTGYMNQYREGRAGNVDRINHILYVMFTLNLDSAT